MRRDGHLSCQEIEEKKWEREAKGTADAKREKQRVRQKKSTAGAHFRQAHSAGRKGVEYVPAVNAVALGTRIVDDIV
jgi:hypothetical protein